jgi:hypothetical protein
MSLVQRELLYRAANMQLTAGAIATEAVGEEAVFRGALLKMTGAMMCTQMKGVCMEVENRFQTSLLEGVLSTAAHSMVGQADLLGVVEPVAL